MNDNKAVLISIQPKWCELIASGKKTVEVRRTKPKLTTPFKCYIYCTKGENVYLPSDIFGNEALNGKVIGEFVCGFIGHGGWYLTPDHPMWVDDFIEESCLTSREMYEYTKGKDFYEWHISDLVIYDKPKELSGFFRYCGDNPKCEGCEAHYYSNTECGLEDYCCSVIDGCRPLKRPPQSWCYVEGGEDDE